MVRISHFCFKGHRFIPWSGNPVSNAVWPNKEIFKNWYQKEFPVKIIYIYKIIN